MTQVSLANLPAGFTLIFDGLFFIYSSQGESCELEMADRVVAQVCEHIHLVRRGAPHARFSSIFLLDGQSPYAKKHTQSKRTYNKSKNMEVVKQRVLSILPNRGVRVVQLDVGEAEAEALHQRQGPVVIVTNDSDMFHLGYRYDRRNESDRVFYAKRRFETIYDFSQPLFRLDRTLFKILLICCGTDFSSSIITRTMFEDIMAHMSVLEQITLPSNPSNAQLLDLIVFFCHLANIKTKPYESRQACYFPKRKGNSTTNLEAYLDIVRWCLEYSNQGAQYPKYCEQFGYVELDLVTALCDHLQLPTCSTQTLRSRLLSYNTHALVAALNHSSASSDCTNDTLKVEGCNLTTKPLNSTPPPGF